MFHMKQFFLVVVATIMIVAQAEKASADVVYWNNNNGSGNRSWSVGSNWNSGTAPTSADTAFIMGTEWSFTSANMPIVSTANNYANQIYVRSGAGLSVTTGGLLNATDLITGQNGASNVVDISGGGQIILSGILNLGAGAFDGKVNISNGSILANNLSINAAGGAGMNIGTNGSFITSYNTGLFDAIQYWVNSGNITANGNAAGWSVNLDTVSQAGKVVVTAVPEPTTLASLGMGLALLAATRSLRKKS